jgi:hypothetical protein
MRAARRFDTNGRFTASKTDAVRFKVEVRTSSARDFPGIK